MNKFGLPDEADYIRVLNRLEGLVKIALGLESLPHPVPYPVEPASRISTDPTIVPDGKLSRRPNRIYFQRSL